MSGGSGGGGGGGFVPRKPVPTGKGGRDQNRCDINIQLPLSATDPAQIKKLKVGDVLDVGIKNSKGVETVVATNRSDKAVVGSVAYRDVQLLIDCMNEGYEYAAKIVSLSATSVKVQIAKK